MYSLFLPLGLTAMQVLEHVWNIPCMILRWSAGRGGMLLPCVILFHNFINLHANLCWFVSRPFSVFCCSLLEACKSVCIHWSIIYNCYYTLSSESQSLFTHASHKFTNFCKSFFCHVHAQYANHMAIFTTEQEKELGEKNSARISRIDTSKRHSSYRDITY
jgi:hypothetical protein